MKFNERYDERVKSLMDKHGVSWLKFDTYNDVIYDSFNSTNEGIVYNNPPKVDGWNGKGKALSFNGTNQYVAMNNYIIPYGEKTVRIRFKYTRTDNPSAENRIFATSTGSNTGLVLDLMHGDYLRILLFNGSTSIAAGLYYPPSFDIFRDQFNLFQVTIDENRIFKAYINDELFFEKQLPQNYDTILNQGALAFSGNTGGAGGCLYGGIVDSFEVFNKAIHPSLFYLNYSIVEHDGKFYTYTNRETSEISSTIELNNYKLQFHTVNLSDIEDLEEHYE